MPKISIRNKHRLLEHIKYHMVPDQILNKDKVALDKFNKMSQKKKARLLREIDK